MDYFNCDSYFIGVSEGVIGYYCFIKMFMVYEGEFVVEEKGIYFIECFFIVCCLMYWQVYLYKIVFVVELMFIQVFECVKDFIEQGESFFVFFVFCYFFENCDLIFVDFKNCCDELFEIFVCFDDIDIVVVVKEW